MSARRRATDDAAISRLTEQRHDILNRAVHALELDHEVPIDAQPESLRETTAMLAASLEELKVAEEELIQQNEELLLTRDAIEATSRHYRRLFEEAPLPYIVTDICGIIKHANRDAARLLKRPAELLERKPLLIFIPLERRRIFRDAINRLQLVDRAHDWRATLLRHGDSTVDVSIEVRLSPGDRDGEDLICWILRPLSTTARVP